MTRREWLAAGCSRHDLAKPRLLPYADDMFQSAINSLVPEHKHLYFRFARESAAHEQAFAEIMADFARNREARRRDPLAGLPPSLRRVAIRQQVFGAPLEEGDPAEDSQDDIAPAGDRA